MLAGAPQWMAARAITWSGGVGSNNEVNFFGQNAQSGGIWAQSNASTIITAGPQTTGPVLVEDNGGVWALPFNVSASYPLYVANIIATLAGYTITTA